MSRRASVFLPVLLTCIFIFVIMTGKPAFGTEKFWPKQLKVLTFNTFGMWVGPIHVGKHWPDRMPMIIESLKGSPADVILLQEVWRAKDKRKFRAALRTLYPHVAESNWGLSSLPLGIAFKGLLGGGLMSFSKYPFFKRPEFHAYRNFTAPEEYFAGKGLQIVPLSIDGRLLVIGHTHLGSSHFDKKINDYVPAQIKNHQEQIREMTGSFQKARKNVLDAGLKAHFLLAGDFNCWENSWNPARSEYNMNQSSYCYPEISSNGDMVDTYRLHNLINDGWTSDSNNPYHTQGEPSARIDYIFSDINPFFLPIGSQVVFKNINQSSPWALSDHYGVMTTFMAL